MQTPARRLRHMAASVVADDFPTQVTQEGHCCPLLCVLALLLLLLHHLAYSMMTSMMTTEEFDHAC